MGRPGRPGPLLEWPARRLYRGLALSPLAERLLSALCSVFAFPALF